MKKLAAAIGLLTCAAMPAAVASEQEGWQFELTPYLWAFGVDGEVTTEDGSANFSQDFGDLTDNIDGGFMGLFAGSYNRIVFLAQYDFADVDLNGDDGDEILNEYSPGARLRGEFDTTIMTGAVGYRFDTFGDHSWIDVMVGVRDIEIEPTLKLTEASGDLTRYEGKGDATDTLIMLRPSIRISDKWRFNPTLSYAVDGDSETHYELSPQFQYQFSDSFAVRFGYRTLNYELESGSDQSASGYRAFDGDLSGLMVGVGWTFPKKQEPVAAAPAPVAAPAPAPAPAPADSDGDGVIDPNDKCPNTPRGSKVDQHGCECDVTVKLTFLFDSADLHDDDKLELDRIAERLTNASWAIGSVEGHTDSIGSDAYNQSLSERRAQAVVEYLASKGIDRTRATAVGRGESQPVADNGTEEGRAQNRRVVLKRTDCN